MYKRPSNMSGRWDKDTEEVIVGLDLGTSKIAVVVAERDKQSGEWKTIDVGQAPSSGIKKGLIVNLDQATNAVEKAVHDAEELLNMDLHNVETTVAFSCGDVESVHTSGLIVLGRTPREVKREEIERVISNAQGKLKDVVDMQNRMILHTIPVEFSLDDNKNIDDPRGMSGLKLEVDLMSVIVPKATLQNVLNCVENAGLTVSAFVIKPLAAALGSLSVEDMESGVVSVDIGGGTCGVAVFKDSRPKNIAVIPAGGEHVTNDVASILKIPLKKAEELKKEVDLFSEDAVKQTGTLEFEYSGRTYTYSLSMLTQVVECRINETFVDLVKKAIQPYKLTDLPGGLVVTGGVSRAIGIEQYLTNAMEGAVRVALPKAESEMRPGRNGPEYTCAAGIIAFIHEIEKDPYRFIIPSIDEIRDLGSMPSGPKRPVRGNDDNDDDHRGAKKGNLLGRFWKKIKDATGELF